MIEEKEIVQLAKLAKLKLSEEEIAALTKDMGEIVTFADKINETLNVVNAAPAERFVRYADLREDEVVESFPQDEILSTVGGGDNGFFPVKRRSSK